MKELEQIESCNSRMLITIEEIKERKKDQLKLIKKIACVA
jgi:hypothetical protein